MSSTDDPTTAVERRRLLAPDWASLAGVIAAAFGWLLPWFQVSDGYSWSFSGWEFLTLTSGGGWTTLVPVGFVATAVALLWSRTSPTAALLARALAIATALIAFVVVAACFTLIQTPGSLDGITTLPFGIGIPLMAAGFGIAIAATFRQHRAGEA